MNDIVKLRSKGVIFPSAKGILTDDMRAKYAMDAGLNQLGSAPNAGIPNVLNTYVDRDVIEFLFAPFEIANIVSEEVQKGDWVHPTAMFLMSEVKGQVVSYGDHENSGSTGFNANFENRQQYYYQTMVRYGEYEEEVYGLAGFQYAAEQQKAAVQILNEAQNTIYARGVQNLENYGILNDPSLPPAIAAAAKYNGGAVNLGTAWDYASGIEVYNDILSLVKSVISTNQGLVKMNSKFTLAIHPENEGNLAKPMAVGGTVIAASVLDYVKKTMPNLEVISAFQYSAASTGAGNIAQLICKEIAGKSTAQCAYSAKLRAHRLVQDTSSSYQKFSQGSFGTVVRRPTAIAMMTGV